MFFQRFTNRAKAQETRRFVMQNCEMSEKCGGYAKVDWTVWGVMVTIVLITMVILSFDPAPASAAGGGGGTTNPSLLNQSFDFGDIHGSYGTYLFDNGNQMSANIAVSSGVVTSCSTNVYPATWLNQPGKTYFMVNAGFNGNYDILPESTTGLNQSLSAEHNEVSVHEGCGLSSYQDWQQGDISVPTGTFWSQSNAFVQLNPFVITNAYGNFSDYSWTDSYSGQTHNEFNYSVNWTGYTTDASATLMFSSIGLTGLSAVPEPPMLALVIPGLLAIAVWRVVRKKK
jgi:hypothetical protein